MRTRNLAGLIVLMVIVAACGNAATTTTLPAQTTSSPAAGATTDEVATTATTATSTTSTRAETTTSAVPSTTAAGAATATVDAAVATVEAGLAEEYEASEPPEGVLGPSEVVCAESGAIPVGTVLGCRLVPNTSSDLQLDEAGVVIYVLDGDGRAAWTVGTDVPDSAAGLADALAFAGSDLMCRDLMDPEVVSGVFGGVGRPADSAYFWSLAYWSLVGAPDRMDADLDGVPCETVHEPAIVAKVLSGGPFS